MKRPHYEFAVRRSAFGVRGWALGVRRLLMLSFCVERWPLSVGRFFSAFGIRCSALGVRRLLTLLLSVGRFFSELGVRRSAFSPFDFAALRSGQAVRCLLMLSLSVERWA